MNGGDYTHFVKCELGILHSFHIYEGGRIHLFHEIKKERMTLAHWMTNTKYANGRELWSLTSVYLLRTVNIHQQPLSRTTENQESKIGRTSTSFNTVNQ